MSSSVQVCRPGSPGPVPTSDVKTTLRPLSGPGVSPVLLLWAFRGPTVHVGGYGTPLCHLLPQKRGPPCRGTSTLS